MFIRQSTRPSASQVVRPGCSVTITGFEPDEAETYHLVAEDEVNPLEGRISVNSELAQALLGARVGQQVSYETPNGWVNLTVLEIDT